MPPLSLADVLAELPDPRSRHGRLHPLLAGLEAESRAATERMSARPDEALGLLGRPPLE